LAKREAEVYRVAFEKEKELTDRVLRLAEVGKPKSNWELQGFLGLAAFFLGPGHKSFSDYLPKRAQK
jgi:hypothetical protein